MPPADQRTRWSRYRVALLLLLTATFFWWVTDGTERGRAPGSASTESGGGHLSDPSRKSQDHRADQSIDRAKHEAERLFSTREAARCRVLSHKKSVESDLYLLGVEPPDEGEVAEVREKLEALEARLPDAERGVFREWLEQAVVEYDPFGEEGQRLIQIDVPDEPNGRLTGFTCSAEDFDKQVRDFQNGEMMNLTNVRGYAASFAGMPLDRFRKLISPEASAPTVTVE